MKKWTYANESQNAYVRFLNLLSANRNQTSTYREVRTKIKREYWNKYPKWENLHRVLLLFSVKYVVIEMLKRRKNGFFCCLRPHGRSGLKWGLRLGQSRRKISTFTNGSSKVLEEPFLESWQVDVIFSMLSFFKKKVSHRKQSATDCR